MSGIEKTQDFYGINGFFTEKGRLNPFGGYFAVDFDCRSNSKELEGLVVDCHGDAFIVGELSDDSLVFDKQYRGRKEVISYQFKKSGRGIWAGSFILGGVGGFKGDAYCKLSLNWKNQKLIISHEELPEEFWDADYVDVAESKK